MAQSLAVRPTKDSVTLARVREIVEQFAERDRHGEIITAVHHIPAREASFAPMPEWVRAELAHVYAEKGVAQLYSHQALAAESVREGRNVVVVTPTASGKTLCYNLPVLNALLENPDARALYLFPTKALAQDQLAELHDLSARLDHRFGVFTYDGDTPADARKAIRERGHIVLGRTLTCCTPEFLPHHTRWQRLFENLRYVVLDELHTYRGVFGSHLANVLRRLRRIARFYGSNPQFICSSATIANPGELASRLAETDFEVIEENGAPAGEKFFVFYNPPIVNRFLGIRRSYINESSRVAQEFLKRNLQTIVFANSRLYTEVLLTYLQQANPVQPGQSPAIRGYRGGYLPGERREIEHGLREGRIRGVVSTNALELGIDVGSLDATIMAGYAREQLPPRGSAPARAGRLQRKFLRGAGRFIGAARSIYRAASRLFFWTLARARLRPAGQSGNSRQPPEVALRLSCQLRLAKALAAWMSPIFAPGLPKRAFSHRTGELLALDSRSLSRGRRKPALGDVGQFRDREHHGSGRSDRRSGFLERAHRGSSEGDLSSPGTAIPRRSAQLRGAESVREARRCGLLHGRHPLHASPRAGKRGERAHRSGRRGRTCRAHAWRRPDSFAGDRLQEDQILHQ